MTRIHRVRGERAPIVGSSPLFGISLGLLLLFAVRASAQCSDLQWRDRVGIAGVNGEVKQLLTWDPDGPGPVGQRLLIVGTFTSAGGQPTRNVAAFDGARWFSMPLGSNDNGSRFTVFQDQVVGLRQLNGSPVRYQPIRWTGTAWEALGPPIGWPGAFGGVAGQLLLADREGGMQRWNGSEWETYPSPPGVWIHWIGEVHGRPQVAGLENNGSGPTRIYEQSIDGTWAAVGGALSGYISSAVEFQGALYVGGGITAAGNVAANGLARFNGEVWEPVGGGLMRDANPGQATALVVHDGALYVAGYFTHVGGASSPNIAQWSGNAWTPMRADELVRGLVEFNGAVIGGSGSYFRSTNAASQKYLAAWNGDAWIGLGVGFDTVDYGLAYSMLRYRDRLFIGGLFTVEGVYASIGVWDGHRLTGTMRAGEAHGLVEYHSQLVAVGQYMGTQPSIYPRAAVAWDETQWLPIEAPGQPFQGTAECVVVYQDELVVGGNSLRAGSLYLGNLARWDGATWSSLGGGTSSLIRDMVVLEGRLIVGGTFNSAGGLPTSGGVASWDGVSWSSMGQIGTAVIDLCLFQGELYAATASPPLRKWDGSQWVSVGNYLTGNGRKLVVYDNKLYLFGDLQFADTGETARVVQWDSGVWTIVPTPPGIHTVNTAEVFRGELYLGQFGPLFDRLGPACPRGDLNGDGVLSLEDIPGLAAALLDSTEIGDKSQYLADVNADGNIDGRDVSAFVRQLTAP